MSVPLSIRLDEQAIADLELLEGEGRTRSETIRQALHEAGQARRHRTKKTKLAEEAARIGADPADRKEAQEIAKFMDSLRDSW